MKTELFENDDVTVLGPGYPVREAVRKKFPKCKMAKDTVLLKDPEYLSTLSGMIPNRHFRGIRDFLFHCDFKKQLHFVICPNKRVNLALALRSNPFFF